MLTVPYTAYRLCWYTPDGRFRRIWDALLVFNLNYVVWLVPIRVFFDVSINAGSTAFFIELFIDVFFLFDIWFNFRTGRRPPTPAPLPDTPQKKTNLSPKLSPVHRILG
jgi:hypothetical protein